jgi:RNA polymerase sigma factor (sigma-70 family)
LQAASATTTRVGLLGGRSPLLRLQSDERLIALLRAGNDAAFDVLIGRYRTRLLAFSRHMLGSREDAEDILQDVFVAAYNAILADQREINARPWLYRIARNRCLNHLRRPAPDGRDTMDDQLHANGTTTADIVHKRADLRHLLADVQKLPETQRTALLLREIDSLTYDQIAHAMETTIPSVKSLLVRARMSLAEAAEARRLTCDEVREELAHVAEGLKRLTPPVKRHVRECEECGRYRKQLRSTSAAMALVFPVGPIFALKKLLLAKAGLAALGGGGGGGAASGGMAATATGGLAATATGGAAAGGAAAGGIAAGGAGAALPIGLGAATSKAIAGIAVTAIIAGGAVEAKKVTTTPPAKPAAPAAAAVAPAPVANPTGGVSLADVPDSLVQKSKVAADPKPQEKAAVGSTGATGPEGTTDSGGAQPSGTTPEHADGAASKGASANGSVIPEETGGAAAPQPAAKPAPVAGSVAGTTAPAGATGP